MEKTRLTFLEPTNFTVPFVIFDTLVADAFHFGFVKNGVANLSGLLNHLLPAMSDYREDLHFDFLKENDGDEELTIKIEECIYKTYFGKYDFYDDGMAKIPFRVNKIYYKDFMKIHDLLLAKYNMDFCNYVRSLLLEYATKRLSQREYFFYYRLMHDLKNAIANQYLCRFYEKKDRVAFIPLSLETSKLNEQNVIIGIGEANDEFYALPLASVQKIVVDDSKRFNITDDAYFAIQDFIAKYESEENS